MCWIEICDAETGYSSNLFLNLDKASLFYKKPRVIVVENKAFHLNAQDAQRVESALLTLTKEQNSTTDDICSKETSNKDALMATFPNLSVVSEDGTFTFISLDEDDADSVAFKTEWLDKPYAGKGEEA